MPQRNLAVELLQKLLKGKISVRRRKNVVQARSFAEMLEQTLRRYQNRAVEAVSVIEELIQIARELREAAARGEKIGLSENELAFYDALETNDSAVQVLGDETLPSDRARAGGDCTWQRHHRLDATRECCAPISADWSSALCVGTATRRTTGESNPDGARTGRGAVR